ncbi:MAG: GNAT family N-acetyltransferase [Lachnospiraceae bacterium]|nr:GNAT family N-acetyltransferase [Lachnospiraceae bacterium]
MEVCFRRVNEDNPEDLRQFYELMADLSDPPTSLDLLQKKIKKTNANEDKYLMVIEDVAKKQICGSLLAVLFDDLCDECRPIMVIENVVTHHDYRGNGIGKSMFDEIEAWGRARNVNYAILCSSMSRTEAHKFYPAIGYEDVKGFKKYL